MKTVVRFEKVSKRYRLGLTRTSLPGLISGWTRQVIQGGAARSVYPQNLWALREISFELGQGRSLALIGPNGAGKTTVLKLLARITSPTEGYIESKGKLSALIELGAGFHPDLTGRENIFLNGTILGLKRSEIKKRFDEIVAFSELEGFIDTPLKRYSSGMSVRLGFAVAACIEPNILLVDEVLAVGDAQFRQKCIERIQGLLGNGTSIIFVSHNLWLVQAICEDALYIDQGRIRQCGKTPDVIEAYDRNLHANRAEKFQLGESEEMEEGDDVVISRIEVLDEDDQVADMFPRDRPVEIRIHYLAYRDLGKTHAVVRILRSDGLTCCMLRTQLDGYSLRVARGPGVISLKFHALQLTGGKYHAHAILRDARDAYSLSTGTSDWFNVRSQEKLFSYSSMNGVFQPPHDWDHLNSFLK